MINKYNSESIMKLHRSTVNIFIMFEIYRTGNQEKNKFPPLISNSWRYAISNTVCTHKRPNLENH